MAEQKNVQEQDINQLIKVRQDKLKEFQENGKDPFQITKYDVTHHSTEIRDNYDDLEGKTVSVAGRMMFKRVMGKASFCNVQDLKGSIQAYVARDSIGEESYKDFKKYDVGDVIGIKGEVFTTKTGEISIHASEVTLLAQELTDPSGEVPWTDQYRYALSSALCGSYHEPGCKGDFRKTFQSHQQHPSLLRRRGIHGS